ncbi:D-alanyl-D-alanine carboxypeptidase family protein [Bacillus sp. FJAT-50079]|uniref:D-alanyl-D-alanine carboxypeptidase family protein n=1 Tax=Bacillus sp. FJAT-50079 TaxID=2833577 RepID=UPI001BC9B19D|nr:D-alanyl-D-alanine carboxypeptidase family protein [Bacillus sp. FJAT-50079]MBS4209564.1 D-alanyl-D-alanine carboxypeptidase [Bacillus sp. FJAT-50079]
MKVKKTRVFLFILLMIGVLFFYKDAIMFAIQPAQVKIDAEAAVIIDEDTGEILFAKNKQMKLYPASTTKLLTALVALDKSTMDEQVIVGEEVYLSVDQEARAGLFEGQALTVEELLAAMLLQSGNDAARSLAVYIAQKELGEQRSPDEAIHYFSQLMNEKAQEIGATHSHFTNPHGLHDPNHYSTAGDMALIAKEARHHVEIDQIVSQEKIATESHTYMNRNQLLNSASPYFYDGATGLKTGFTDQAGYCLASSAERHGRKLVAVVLNSGKETVWSDSISLLDYGFEK